MTHGSPNTAAPSENEYARNADARTSPKTRYGSRHASTAERSSASKQARNPRSPPCYVSPVSLRSLSRLSCSEARRRCQSSTDGEPHTAAPDRGEQGRPASSRYRCHRREPVTGASSGRIRLRGRALARTLMDGGGPAAPGRRVDRVRPGIAALDRLAAAVAHHERPLCGRDHACHSWRASGHGWLVSALHGLHAVQWFISARSLLGLSVRTRTLRVSGFTATPPVRDGAARPRCRTLSCCQHTIRTYWRAALRRPQSARARNHGRRAGKQ